MRSYQDFALGLALLLFAAAVARTASLSRIVAWRMKEVEARRLAG